MAKVLKTCAVCGAAFEVWPNRANTAKVCSTKCRGASNGATYARQRPTKQCVVCGRQFTCPPSHDKRVSCCSRKCANELSRRRQVPKGADHFNWKGGTTRHTDGYLYVRADGHLFTFGSGYVFEHRLIVEAWMRDKAPDHRFLVVVDGEKYLRPDIDVHHRNENKRDNRIQNLLACTKQAHRDIHNGNPPMEGEVWPPVVGMVPFEPHRVQKTCETCKGQFTVKRAVARHGGGRFCCRACYVGRAKSLFSIVTQ